MIQVQSLNGGVFTINGKPYQKGSAIILQFDNDIALKEIKSETISYVSSSDFTEWLDGGGAPFATVEDLLTYLGLNILL